MSSQTAASNAIRFRRLFVYRPLVKYLVLKDIKVKSRGTYLGIAWTLMNPLITIMTYFVVFGYVFRSEIPNFLAYFLLGFLMWAFFARAVTSAAICITANDSIIKRAPFPLETLPLAAVLYELFHHSVALAVSLPLMLLFWGARFSWNLLWVGIVLVAFICFTLAVALWVATLGVFFRDTRDILEVGLPIIFWTTPIFYTMDMLPAWLRSVSATNPVSIFMVAARTALLDAAAPSLAHLAIMALWLVGMILSGSFVFSRYSPRFAEEL
jgi:ABC-type polysaccharide/polyol phosphate export permease